MRFLTLIASIIATLAKVGVSLSLFAIIFVSWISVVSLKCLRDEGRKIEDLAWDILELLCNTLMQNLNFSPKNQFWWILLQNWIWIFPPKNGIIENLIFLNKNWDFATVCAVPTEDGRWLIDTGWPRAVLLAKDQRELLDDAKESESLTEMKTTN